MSDKTLQGGGAAVEQMPSLSAVNFRGNPETTLARQFVEAEPHALPGIEGSLVKSLHLGALREGAQKYTAQVPLEIRAALDCPSANIRLAA